MTEKQKIASKNYYEKNKNDPDFKKRQYEYVKKWRSKNIERVREKNRERERRVRAEKKRLKIEGYNNKIRKETATAILKDLSVMFEVCYKDDVIIGKLCEKYGVEV